MTVKVEGAGVKVLGGGTQAYNKNTIDKRRPLIMKSPYDKQKAVRIAKDPIYKDLLKDIDNYKAEIVIYEELMETLQKAHNEELDIRHNIIKDLENKNKAMVAAEVKAKKETVSKAKKVTKPVIKKTAPIKVATKKPIGE